MNELSKNRLVTIIDWIVISVLGVFCYCYSIFWSYFAEVNIKLPFLDFPIFVGEILLGFCILMFWVKVKISQLHLNRWHYLILAYAAFILFKTFHGYFTWGPLAFRNAALFYYSFFAVIGYYFYSSEFFKNRHVRFTILFLVITTVFLRKGYKTFYFEYFMLVLLFFMETKRKIFRYVFILAFIVVCYNSLLITLFGGRNVLVSSIISYAFLFIILGNYFFRLELKIRVFIFLFIFIALSFAFWHISGNKKAAESLLNIKAIIEGYRKQSTLIMEREKYFHFANPSVKVYDKNEDSVWDIGTKSLFKTKSEFVKEPTQTQSKSRLIKESTLPQVNSSLAVKSEFLSKEEAKYVLQEFDESTLQEVIKSQYKEEIVSRDIEGQYKFVAIEDEAIGEDSLEGKAGTNSKDEVIRCIVNNYSISRQTISDIGNTYNIYQVNIFYRLFLIRDMFVELGESKNIFGMNFGKPFRSKTLEMLRLDEGWKTRVGWVEPHNSYVHMIYRAGIVALLFIAVILTLFFKMVVAFVKARKVKGILLMSIILYWLVVANCMVILELPHWAIPFWILFGMTVRYWHAQKDKEHAKEVKV